VIITYEGGNGDGRPARFATPQPAQEQAKYGVLGLEDLLARDFGCAAAAILEDDRHFADLPAASLAEKEHLDQEGVAAGEDLVQRNGEQHLAAVEAKAGRRVARP